MCVFVCVCRLKGVVWGGGCGLLFMQVWVEFARISLYRYSLYVYILALLPYSLRMHSSRCGETGRFLC